MEEAFNQLKKEFDALRASFTECRTELALSKCKSDHKIAELQRQVAALVESNADLVRRLNYVSPKKVAPPWEKPKNVAVETGEKAPWDQDSQKGAISSDKTSENPAEEKEQPCTTVQKEAAASKPVSRGKDWDTICREISSDDDEEERVRIPAGLSEENVITRGQRFIKGFVELFYLYCDVLESGKFNLLHSVSDIPFEEIRSYEANAYPEMGGYAALAEGLSSDVRKVANRPMFCSACNFTMSSFYLVLNHLTDNNHHQCRLGELAKYHKDFVMISELLNRCFYQFVARPYELQEATREEIEMAQKARQLALKHTDRSRHRPSDGFIASYLLEKVAGSESVVELLTIMAKHGEVKTVAKFIEVGECKQRIVTKLREWFAIKKNKEQFDAKFKNEMKGGIPYCSMCEQAFDSPTLYYRHVTSYGHARVDQSIFSLTMSVWKGDEYWDPMIALVEE